MKKIIFIFYSMCCVLNLAVAGVFKGDENIDSLYQKTITRKNINIDLLSLSKGKNQFTWQIHQPDSENLTVVLNDVVLPTGSWLEIINENHQDIYNDKFLYDGSRPQIVHTAEGGGTLFIRLIKNASHSDGHVVISEYNYVPKNKSRAIIGSNQMKFASCYEKINPTIFRKSHAVVKTNGSSGWNVVGGGYVLTNKHVAGEVGNKIHNLYYNYQSPTCEKETLASNTLNIKTRKVILAGGSSSEDYAVYKVDELAYEEAGIKQIFGTLAINSEISMQDLNKGVSVYIPQHPWGAYKRISSLRDDGGACRTLPGGEDNVVRYDCDTDGGASGSAVLSEADNRVVALHFAGGTNYNVGVLGQHVYTKIKSLLPDSNNSQLAVSGEGKLMVSEKNIYPYMPTQRTDLNYQHPIVITSLYDNRLSHYSDYSIFKAKKRVAGGEVVEINVRFTLETPCGETNLAGDHCDKKGERYLHMALDKNDDIIPGSGWITLRVNNEHEQRLSNLVIPFNYFGYDPFSSPFSDNEQVENYTLTSDSVLSTNPIQHHSNFGFIAVHPGQGPQSLTTSDTGHSTLIAQVHDDNHKVHLVKLRGYRKTSCTPPLRPISSTVGCGSGARPASLELSFEKEDNKQLPPGNYSGLLPLLAKRDTFEKNILVHLSLKKVGSEEPLVADAGKDITVEASTDTSRAYELDGSASQNALSYEWTIAEGADKFWLQEKHAGSWVKKVGNVRARALIPANTIGKATYLLTVTGKDGKKAESRKSVIVKAMKEKPSPSIAEWEATKAYAQPCTKVRFNQKVWLNGWWSKGEKPSDSGTWGVWREQGASHMHAVCK
ncbi:trypsin-like peptidase domain-containing protein [Serratia sp. AKBS12]|uniref:trypsin-like peptidase domain-containing protein n=1 Tax=Serratia sp. AKBS12 TaxID=2974597 RepID=UPI002165CAE9|nr:trypsin-like peptidase domain-containing protein [Serratia sp. AKBS12]MCS3409320.1 trypsin-like peptidase domain-containing protein [Serratia sp. AKBS12]